MVKLVMGLIMILVALSRMIAVPIYLSDLGRVETLSNSTISVLNVLSVSVLVSAMVIGATIILFALWYGLREDIQKHEALEEA